MNNKFWDEMYSDDAYAYGTNPNDFLAGQTFAPKSKILCLAEGQGRNAVHLAMLGHEITMIDYSSVGLAKAQILAESKNVSITTICEDLNEYVFEKNTWDAIVIIFGHFPPKTREIIYPKLFDSLKKCGKFVSETYAKDQIKYQTGGPQDENMLTSIEEFKFLLSKFNHLDFLQLERNIEEGKYHNGLSSVIQIIATK